MARSAQSGIRRAVIGLGTALVLLAGLVAWPAFTRGESIPFASPTFASQWNAAEAILPNFWGPALQPAIQEQYKEAAGGLRTVQYFDKARMEQGQAGGGVTNGLLTVELISGKRQFGDTTFTTFVPSHLSIVGDVDNAWPPYAALSGTTFPAKVARTGEPTGVVSQPDGTLTLNPALAADPGAAYGSWQRDPGGVYAHNIPHAFWRYLTGLPVPWQTAMGYPLTEAFWVNVRVAGVPMWVMTQPFERRVLSYTPTNPPAFQVEMGNIGLHYYQWRYGAPDAAATGTIRATQGTTGTATTTGTVTATSRASSTPPSLAITNVQLGAVTDTTFTVNFRTNSPARSRILYGTQSHTYAYQQEIATTATQDHAITLTDLDPGTKYYFALRAMTDETSIERREDYFSTTGVSSNLAATATSTSEATATATHTATPTHTPTPIPTPTNTPIPTATSTAKPTATSTPAPTNTPVPTNTPIPTSTSVPPKNIRVSQPSAAVGASSDTQLSPSVMQWDAATVSLSLSYDGASGNAATTMNLTNWSHDAANARMTGTGSGAPLTLIDKQTTIVITATVTVPFVDPTTPALTVSFTRKLTSAEYAAGTMIVSAPLSNTKSFGYNVVISLAVSLA